MIQDGLKNHPEHVSGYNHFAITISRRRYPENCKHCPNLVMKNIEENMNAVRAIGVINDY